MTHAILDRLVESYNQQSVGFHTLRPFQVRDILLVASLYDSYTLAEDGRVAETIYGEFRNLALSAPAYITRVPTGEAALEVLKLRRFDLVITMTRVGDLTVSEFGARVKEIDPDLPVYLMTYDTREFTELGDTSAGLAGIDDIFVWRGDTRLFLALIKLVEDRLNVDHDTKMGNVRVLILVEDSIPFYSSYLPMLFDELMQQTGSLIHEGVNSTQKLLRMRARPKILLAKTHEEAWRLYKRHEDTVLGVISDVRFPREGVLDSEAGIELIRGIRAEDPFTPLVLQSSDMSHKETAEILGVTFIYKNSPTLHHEFHRFMIDNLGFGDFVFRLPDGTEVGRAGDLSEMVKVLESIPPESLQFHGRLNHFSNWLMARTEFSAANALRARDAGDFETVEEMRQYLKDTLVQFRLRTRRGYVEEFEAERFDATTEFVRIGKGSLGGKGRGLAFIHELLSRNEIERYFDGFRIFVPQTAVLATSVFDRFLEENDLLEFALREEDDHRILQRFLSSRMPRDVVEDLATLLDKVRWPLAIRSSSLLEDSHFQPFAGVYCTRMIPNVDRDPEVRLQQLLDAVKYIYASTYFQEAKAYVATTPNRMEEERMAIIIQKVIGRNTESFVYPHVSGVARSVNYYPVEPMKSDEGIASVALGLGKTVVEGGATVRFSPAHPESLPQFSRTEDVLRNVQRRFWALGLAEPVDLKNPDSNLVELEVADAERHGMLWPVASTYSHEDDRVHDGASRPGVRLVTFAPLLKGHIAPFGPMMQLLLELGYRGLSGPVEIEFAMNLEPQGGGPRQFAFLQIRPIALTSSSAAIVLEETPQDRIFVHSPQALGNGRFPGLRDIVSVRRDSFERGRTPEVALEVGKMNEVLRDSGRNYVLIGPGRWGSADRWLGIPVTWRQISEARVILECDLADLKVEPSQGTHFFQNITSYGVGYFNVQHSEGGFIDEDWLETLDVVAETEFLRHYHLPEDLEIAVDGRKCRGMILKPE